MSALALPSGPEAPEPTGPFSSSSSCGLLPLSAMEEEEEVAATVVLAGQGFGAQILTGCVSKTKKHARQRRPVKRSCPGPAILTLRLRRTVSLR